LMEFEWLESQLFTFVELRSYWLGRVRNSKPNYIYSLTGLKVHHMGVQTFTTFQILFDFTLLQPEILSLEAPWDHIILVLFHTKIFWDHWKPLTLAKLIWSFQSFLEPLWQYLMNFSPENYFGLSFHMYLVKMVRIGAAIAFDVKRCMLLWFGCLCSLQNTCCNLTLNAEVLRDGTFSRWLSHEGTTLIDG
jgi:hypothetical protein